ncbi:MAG: TIGR00730 family Rossman fold protein [Endomicrobiaceae bacterium]
MKKSICVFCGSSTGLNDTYKNAAVKFAEQIVKEDLTLIYGGGNRGLMGIISDTVINTGGKVIGVIPEFLSEKKLGNTKVTELKVVCDMHTRKATMYKISDFFVALPGGIGTIEEITEILTWRQLFLHQKPCALLNINGFFDDFVNFLNKTVSEGFMNQTHLDNLIVEPEIEQLMNKLKNYICGAHVPKF